MSGKTHLMEKRLIFSLVIILVYLIFHKIPLNGLDMSKYQSVSLDLSALLTSMVNGSASQKCYVMSLGISPYITSGLIVMVLMAFRSKEAKARTSPMLQTRLIVAITFIVSLIQAIDTSSNLYYVEKNLMNQLVCVFELMAGASLVQYLVMVNKQYGIGNAMPIIFINMLESLFTSFKGASIENLQIPLILSILAAMFMIFMELSEKHIPLQRVSVHNEYSEKDFLSIKYNPVGFMAILFSSIVFMLPRLICQFIYIFVKDNSTLIWVLENLNMQKTFGTVIYILTLFILTIVLSFLFVNPKEISENFLQNGDSIVDIPAGKPTIRYLSKYVLLFSFFSACISCGFLGVSLYMQLQGIVPAQLAMVPSTIMMSTGIFISFYTELRAYHDFDSYKRFI